MFFAARRFDLLERRDALFSLFGDDAQLARDFLALVGVRGIKVLVFFAELIPFLLELFQKLLQFIVIAQLFPLIGVEQVGERLVQFFEFRSEPYLKTQSPACFSFLSTWQ